MAWALVGRKARTCVNVGKVFTASVIIGRVSTGVSWKVRISCYLFMCCNLFPFSPHVFVTAAWKEMRENKSDFYERTFRCLRCAPGCARCKGPEPCLATYNWPFRYFFMLRFILSLDTVISIVSYHFSRITLLAVSIFCAFGTIVLVAYMYQHRKLKVFKVASPIFLSITLLGCALMYLEVGAEKRSSLSLLIKSPSSINLKQDLRRWPPYSLFSICIRASPQSGRGIWDSASRIRRC